MCSSTNLLIFTVGWFTELHIGLPGIPFLCILVVSRIGHIYNSWDLGNESVMSPRSFICFNLENILSETSFVGSWSIFV